MTAIRVVFMGTPSFAVPTLEALVADEAFDVRAVVTQPDRPAGRGQRLTPSPVKTLALAHGLALLQPEKINTPQAWQALEALGPIDLAVVAAFGQILRPHLLAWPKAGCLNVHASLLPRWRGAAPVPHAILAGDAELGVSLMQMEAGMDTGPILATRALPARPPRVDGATSAQRSDAHYGPSDWDTGTALEALAHLGAALTVEVAPQWVCGTWPAEAQDAERATYAPKFDKSLGFIETQRDGHTIERMIRAFSPSPGASLLWQGQRLKVLSAALCPQLLPEPPQGATLRRLGKRLYLDAPDGKVLRIERVQVPGKASMDAATFLAGYGDRI